MMDCRERYLILLFIAICIPNVSQCLSEGRLNIVDRLLRVVWDPSSLVRFWVGLDQLRNIASSWKEVGLNLITLPLRQDREEPGMGDYVRINGRNRALGRIKKDSTSSHSERFAKAYSDISASAYKPINLGNLILHGGQEFPPPFSHDIHFAQQGLISLDHLLQPTWNNDISNLRKTNYGGIDRYSHNSKRRKFGDNHISNHQTVQKLAQESAIDVPNVILNNAEPHVKLKMFLKLLKEIGPRT